jgi:Ca2+-binding RTX toxin-like protein
LKGGRGNDVLFGSVGADAMDGGPGLDTADYSTSSKGVIVNLGNGASSGGDAQGDVLKDIENVIGSNSGDALTGSSESNRLSGGGGVDVIRGGDGDDYIDGGVGDDQLFGDAGDDLIDPVRRSPAVTAALSASLSFVFVSLSVAVSYDFTPIRVLHTAGVR